MLEMLDLSREDQNGTEDTASKYIAAEGESEHFEEYYSSLIVPSFCLYIDENPDIRRQDHLVAGLVDSGYHHHIHNIF